MAAALQAGLSYIRHDGPLQANDGTVTLQQPFGAGGRAGDAFGGRRGPGHPGLSANFRLTDAVFQPRIAEQAVAAQRQPPRPPRTTCCWPWPWHISICCGPSNSKPLRGDAGPTAILAEPTAAFAGSGQGNQADADRAQTELALRRNAVAQAAAEGRVALARLAELLGLDPSCLLAPEEPTVLPIDLVPQQPGAGPLVAEGLSQRPELRREPAPGGGSRRASEARARCPAPAQRAAGR